MILNEMLNSDHWVFLIFFPITVILIWYVIFMKLMESLKPSEQDQSDYEEKE